MRNLAKALVSLGSALDRFCAKYSPDEPRDQQGRWTSGGRGEAVVEGPGGRGGLAKPGTFGDKKKAEILKVPGGYIFRYANTSSAHMPYSLPNNKAWKTPEAAVRASKDLEGEANEWDQGDGPDPKVIGEVDLSHLKGLN